MGQSENARRRQVAKALRKHHKALESMHNAMGRVAFTTAKLVALHAQGHDDDPYHISLASNADSVMGQFDKTYRAAARLFSSH